MTHEVTGDGEVNVSEFLCITYSETCAAHCVCVNTAPEVLITVVTVVIMKC